jgi:hypothetical protein
MVSAHTMVVVDPSTFELHQNGKITGRVYVKMGPNNFPDSQWNDFVVIVLGWWCDALARMIVGLEDSPTLSFMDGPFELAVTQSGSRLLLKTQDRRNRLPSELIEADRDAFCRSVLEAAELTIGWAATKSYSDSDVEKLRESGYALASSIA